MENNSLSALKGAGAKTITLLSKLGIVDIPSLLSHYPRSYENRLQLSPLSDYYKKKEIYTEVVIKSKDWFGFGGQKTLKVFIGDGTSDAVLLCFGRSAFMNKTLQEGDKIRIFAHFYYKYGEIQSSRFEIDKKDELALLPVYPLTEGLTQNTLRKLIKDAIENYGDSFIDEIPADIIERDSFFHKKDAIKNIHFPDTENAAEIARRTIIYEELFKFAAVLAKRSAERKKVISEALKKSCAHKLQKRLIERLPFELTEGQNNAVKEINADLESGVPMERLLQGDVGSGKTLVSFLASLSVIEMGGQAALLAPTELLAMQHAENAAKLLEPLGVHVAFLSGNVSAKNRRPLLDALFTGGIDFVCGTHALFSADTIYKNLNLVIIDEQHRFGIEQRRNIIKKGKTDEKKPHLLMMSATPIPRTLALTAFGDWDISIIKGMPKNRLPVETHLARFSNIEKVYKVVQRELEKGHKAYFVYPLIEKIEKIEKKDGAVSTSLYKTELKDAMSAFTDLQKNIFPKYKVALLHSQIDEDEKRRIMNAFRAGEIDILAATSIVEVGVDVPSATCMVIEHAERFGVSALHQLRGRVGRGDAKSYCFLSYPDEYTEEMKERLMTVYNTNDGFEIAEQDLRLRGPGQVLGTDQSGFFKLGLADPIRDEAVLKKAREDAGTRV